MPVVEYHPEFEQQFIKLQSSDRGIFLDIAILVSGLESHGRLLEGEDHPNDPSHPIVTSRYDLWALRRTPPTWITPDSPNSPPVLRVPYQWFADRAGEHYVVVWFIGDKTELQNAWYPSAVRKIENDLMPRWIGTHPDHTPLLRKRRTP